MRDLARTPAAASAALTCNGLCTLACKYVSLLPAAERAAAARTALLCVVAGKVHGLRTALSAAAWVCAGQLSLAF